jgi:hypothetical protein
MNYLTHRKTCTYFITQNLIQVGMIGKIESCILLIYLQGLDLPGLKRRTLDQMNSWP